MAALITIEALAIALLGFLVVGLLRSHAEILKALHDLGVSLDPDDHEHPGTAASRHPGSRLDGATVDAADVAGQDAAGNAVALAVTGGSDRTLLAFLTTGCMTCTSFWDAFRDPGSLGLPAGVRLVVVTKGSDQESPGRVAELEPPGVPVVMSTQAWLDYEIQVAPYFVLVDGGSGEIVGEGAGSTWAQVRSLLGQALTDSSASGPRRLRPSTDAEREAEVDRALLDAGLEPGDPRLYHEPPPRAGG